MALINCPECNQSVSDTARKCPYCGYTLHKINAKKWLIVIGAIALSLVLLASVYYFLIYAPKQLPLKAAALLEQGDYVGADKIYARMGKSEENLEMREQLFYESRILNAAKAVQDFLLFPDTMILSEILIWADEELDESVSTDTQKVYSNIEPEILLHYLAQSRGGSMTDGYVCVFWDDGEYQAGRSVDDLTVKDELPWYMESDDFEAKMDFWSEQIVKGEILDKVYRKMQIGSFNMERCNALLKATFGKKVEMIPAGEIVVTPTPRVVVVTPKPDEQEKE